MADVRPAHLYSYVGPADIGRRRGPDRIGRAIRSAADVVEWMTEHGMRLTRTNEVRVTFVVDAAGTLRIADRRSEHVACAGGQPVRSAGELCFSADRAGNPVVLEASNQSTGFCPEPESWPEVAAALARAGLPAPEAFTQSCEFRRCPACRVINIIKDNDFGCAACSAALPHEWNLAPAGEGAARHEHAV